jgi:putative ABC transport system ATP-binding protein
MNLPLFQIMTTLIQVINIQKQYENDEVITKVLHGITFNIEAGEFVAIMGPSGSGKSTLMNILGFLDRPTSGEFLFKGTNTKDFNEDQMADFRNQEIGFIFQSFNLLPRTTVIDNVRLPLLYSKIPHHKHDELIKNSIMSVGLWHRKLHFSNQLSGGEKQRVAIARALVNQPSIIFADEPTGNLDSKTGGQIMLLLQRLNDDGHTIVLVTHEKYTAEHAKRILKIRDGRLESDELVNNRLLVRDGEELLK